MTVENPETTRILIVDDTPTNLQVLSESIRVVGWTTLVATDGETAIEQAEYARPDLILLDVMMPGIDGFETCRRLKANPITEAIPVIFMTALSDTLDKVKGLEIGAVDYITKPFQQEEVLARVKLHLKLYHLTQTLEQRVSERTAELSESLRSLQQAQLQLVQSEKMSTLGQLVAGVAHEINNPVGFIAGNLNPAKTYIQELFDLLSLYQQKFPDPGVEIEKNIKKIDLAYLREDLPKLISSMRDGVDRIRTISVSLRTFSRSDIDHKEAFDIHEALNSTTLILKYRLKANEFRPEIEVIKEYDDLPLVKCFPGQLNQALMNLLANAIDAVEESNQGRSYEEIEERPNQITVQTALAAGGQQAVIRIRDNGLGMADEVQQRIFDHLFTTKPVGKGTGLGLAIARQIIVERHGGTLEVNSRQGEGSEFIITLPL
jgi:signal transduction histidine kinase